MRVLLINSVCGIGSTGRICTELAQQFEKEGHEVKIAYGRDRFVPDEFRKCAVRIGNDLDVKLHGIRTRLLDGHGFGSLKATKEFLKWAEDFNPDMVWLHNIHGYFINVELLFEWIKRRPSMQVKWTLHDCWAFTGHCVHFSAVDCTQWKQECKKCMQKGRYPSTLFRDNAQQNFKRKKEAFSNVSKMTIITPSNWLANLVRDSFLGQYPVEVHYNFVDKSIFKPTQSDFREKYGLQGRKIILGVANAWDDRKGLYDFYELSNILCDKYVIVLVGLTQKQIRKIPSGIIGIERTKNIDELVKIYSMSDVYVNLSKEETFGLTTVEAIYCGIPTIVYKDTACEEVAEKLGGIVVEPNLDSVRDAIYAII